MISARQLQAAQHFILCFVCASLSFLICSFFCVSHSQPVCTESLEFHQISTSISRSIDQAQGHFQIAVMIHTRFGDEQGKFRSEERRVGKEWGSPFRFW